MIDYNTQDSPSYEPTKEGEHNAIIISADTYSNPNGPDKLMVKFGLEDQSEHMEFITPSIMEGDGFRCFADLLAMISDEKTLPESGSFDEQDLVGLECIITIKQTKGKGKHEGKTFANIQKIEAPKKKA